MIQISKVSKHYGSFQVLKECTTSVSKGEVIVDVEALVAEFTDRWENSDPSGAYDALRAALRKVGKR